MVETQIYEVPFSLLVPGADATQGQTSRDDVIMSDLVFTLKHIPYKYERPIVKVAGEGLKVVGNSVFYEALAQTNAESVIVEVQGDLSLEDRSAYGIREPFSLISQPLYHEMIFFHEITKSVLINRVFEQIDKELFDKEHTTRVTHHSEADCVEYTVPPPLGFKPDSEILPKLVGLHTFIDKKIGRIRSVNGRVF